MFQQNETFFWYGTTQKYAPAWISKGINLYSSEDLQQWRFEAQIFNASQITGSAAHYPYRIERPKVLFLPRFGIKHPKGEADLLVSQTLHASPDPLPCA